MRSSLYSGVAALAIVACGSLVPEPERKALSEPRRLLFVTLGDKVTPELAQQVLNTKARAAAAAHPPQLHRLKVDDYVDAVQRLQALGRGLDRYALVMVDSISLARAVQLKFPHLPLLFEGVDDPVARCVVDRLDRPGRNATGYMHYLHNDDIRALQVLRDAFPALSEVHVLVDHENEAPLGCDPQDAYWTNTSSQASCTPGRRAPDEYLERRLMARQLDDFAHNLGLRLHFEVVCDMAALGPLVRQRSQAAGSGQLGWLVPYHNRFDRDRQAVVDAINVTRRPAIFPTQAHLRLGGLMALSPILDNGAARPLLRTMVQALDGAPLAGIPVQSPRGFELAINLQAAQAMGLQPSLRALRTADRLLY